MFDKIKNMFKKNIGMTKDDVIKKIKESNVVTMSGSETYKISKSETYKIPRMYEYEVIVKRRKNNISLVPNYGGYSYRQILKFSHNTNMYKKLMPMAGEKFKVIIKEVIDR